MLALVDVQLLSQSDADPITPPNPITTTPALQARPRFTSRQTSTVERHVAVRPPSRQLHTQMSEPAEREVVTQAPQSWMHASPITLASLSGNTCRASIPLPIASDTAWTSPGTAVFPGAGVLTFHVRRTTAAGTFTSIGLSVAVDVTSATSCVVVG